MKNTKTSRSKSLDFLLKRLKELSTRKSQSETIIYFILIENLEMLNLAYGHKQADKLISGLCDKLQKSIEKKDSDSDFFRIYDDQLVIMVHAESSENKDIKKQIEKLISSYGLAAAKDKSVHISTTIVSERPRVISKDAYKIIDRLYAKALANRKIAEEIDENKKEVTQEKSVFQMKMANQIYNALNKKNLRLAYQPIIDARTGEVAHYEALLRIIDKDGKLSSAGTFIPVAEKMGIINDIDVLVLEMVLDELQKQPQAHLALNISKYAISNTTWKKILFDRINEELASRLIVEITESSATKDMAETAYFIAMLQNVGCRVALDDFGSGYTSFRQIKALSLDMVKIDGSLIHDMSNNHHNELLVRSLLEFFKGLKIKTIAEHVDSGETTKLLLKYGIDYMQGNYFCDALPSITNN